MHDSHEHSDRGHDITVVAPNGAKLAESYHRHERVAEVLEKSVKEFGKRGDLDPGVPYLLVLGDSPLENGLTLEEAHVKAHDTLKIRSKKIPGDGDASGVL